MHKTGFSKQHKKRITVLSHSPNIGGAELALKSLVESTLEEIEWTVVVASQTPPNKKIVVPNVRYVSIDLPWWCYEANDSPRPITKKSLASSLKKLQKIAKDADVLMTNTLTIPWMAIIAGELHIPHVWYVHEFGTIDHNLQFVIGYDESLNFINRYSNRVLTIGTAMKNHLASIIDVNKIDIIHQSIDLQKLLSIDLEKAESKDSYRLLCLGAIKPSKGQHIAIKAVQNTKRVNISLDVLGPVADAEYLTKISKNLPNNINVQPGYVDIVEQLKSHDAVLMCSENEALGRVTLESLAAGKLVIGYACDSTAELLSNNRGVLYSPNSSDALGDALDAIDKYFSSIDREKSRNFVSETYNNQRQKDDFIKCISSVTPNELKPQSSDSRKHIIDIYKSKNLVQTFGFREKIRKLRIKIVQSVPRPVKQSMKKFLH